MSAKIGIAIVCAILLIVAARAAIVVYKFAKKDERFAVSVLVPKDCWDECTSWCNSIGDGPICYHDCKSKCQWP